jgi:hypothetical protein
LNPFNLADRELVLGPVVELGGPGRLMRSHLLGMLKPASVFQVNRHTGRAPGVAPDRRQNGQLVDLAFAAEPDLLDENSRESDQLSSL